MTVVVRKRGEDYNYFINLPFRKCKVDDFKKRGLIDTERNLLYLENTQFCPDFDKY